MRKFSSRVDQKCHEIMHYAYENGILDFKQYVKVYRTTKKSSKIKVSRESFRKSYLRYMFVNDLKMAAITCGFKIFDNDFGIYVNLLNALMDFLKDEVKTVFLVFMPRGTMKSVMCQSLTGLWRYVHDTITLNQAPTIPMIHGNEQKSSMNLKLLKLYAKTDIMQYLFPDILEFVVDNDNEAEFKNQNSLIPRKEPHFITMSVNSDPQGEHYGTFCIDDWVTFKNTATIAMNEKNKSKYRALISLEDHLYTPKFIQVGTRHWTDDIYTELIDNAEYKEYVTIFEMPAAKYADLDREDNIFYFRQLPKHKLKRYKIAFENEPHVFMSQYFNIPKDRSERLLLSSDLPEYFNPANNNVDIEVRCLICDPAVSKKNKFSRLIIHAVYITTDKKIFVVETFSAVGTTPNEFKNKIIDMAAGHLVEYVIIESIAAQEYMRLDIEEEKERRRKEGTLHHDFIVIGHKHRENKIDHYMSFLEPLFNRKQIYINPICNELIRQAQNKSSMNDEIDCLSFIIELRKQRGFDFTNYDIHQEEVLTKEIYKKQLKNRSKYNIIGYKWM